MAKDKPWCIDPELPLIEIQKIAEIWIDELEAVHQLVSTEEWGDIIDAVDADNIPDNIKTKPATLVDTSNGLYGTSQLTFELMTGKDLRVDGMFGKHYLETTVLKKIYSSNSEHLSKLKTLYQSLLGQHGLDSGAVLAAEAVEITEEDRIRGSFEVPDEFYYEENKKYLKTFWGTDGYTSYTVADFQKVVSLIRTNPPATVTSEFTSLLSMLDNGLQLNFSFIQCVPSLTEYLKDYYNQELQKLAYYKLQDAEFETLVKQAKAISSFDDFVNLFSGVDPELLDNLKNKIQQSIRQQVVEAFADNLIYSEQCFMLTNLSHLIKYKKKLPLSFPLPYSSLQADKNQDLCGVSKAAEQSSKNNPLMIQGQPFSFMNKLAVEPTQQALFDIMPHELSSLTPNIRLFKVVTDKKNNEEKEIPITFEISTISPRSEEGLYFSQRGTGVGLKSFKFSYDGTDPFSAKKAISADLSIFASSFNDLLRIRNEGSDQYRYTDLALKTGTKKDKSTLTDLERENLDKLNFRLKVVVQWSASKEGMRSIKRPEIKDALYDSAITLYLTPVIHTFDFDEQGSVVFNISYQAYIEDFFTNENFNVFSQLNMIKEGRKYVLDFFKDVEGCDLLSKEFKEFQKFDSAFILDQNRKALNSIISNLHSRKNIHYLNMSYDEISEWKKNPSGFKLKKIPISNSATGNAAAMVDAAVASGVYGYTAGEIEDAVEEIRASLVANSQENQNIPFFYLSDLISVVMNMIEDQLLIFDEKDIFVDSYINQLDKFGRNAQLKEYISKKYEEEMPEKKFGNIQQFKKMRIVLGPLEISKISNEKTTNQICTIGDIPISLNYFIDFLSDKVIARDLSHYPISKFVKDIINQLLKEFINSEDCSGANTSQRVSVNSTTVVGYNTRVWGLDTITELCSSYAGKHFQKGVLILDQLQGDVFPLVKISGDRSNPNTNKGIEMMTNFYVFSAGRTYPTDKFIGNRAIDASAGIFHYILGQDKGIVKNIKLQKTNTPGLKEVRFEQEGYAGLEQLREVYNVAIDCYLNPQTFPGTYIYIPPEGFSPSSVFDLLLDDNGNKMDLTKFGIGGYYMITKTTHQIAPGVGDTSIEAAWVASKDGKYGKLDSGNAEKRGEGEGTEKVKKCKINSSETGR